MTAQKGKGCLPRKKVKQTYATATFNILHEKSKKSLRRREAKNIKQRDKNLGKVKRKRKAAARMRSTVGQRKGMLRVKRNRARSAREMTSFYRGQEK
jgi:hypothetical protein